MHELSIAAAIVDIALEELNLRGGSAVVAVHLKLGPLSGVVRESLTSAFELACEGSSLEKADLVIEQTEIAIFCPECQAEQAVRSIQDMRCVECGHPGYDIVRGRELEVVAMEIES